MRIARPTILLTLVTAGLLVSTAVAVSPASASAPSAGLAVTITPGASSPELGYPGTTNLPQASPERFTISVTNRGPNTAPAANLHLWLEQDPNTFHLILPAGFSTRNSPYVADWAMGNLAVGQTVQATFTIIGQEITGANPGAVSGALILTATSKVANPLLRYSPHSGDTWSTSRIFKTVRPVSRNPFGYLDSVTASGSSIRARGWAADPDNLFSPLPIALSNNGARTGGMRHPISRPDVAQARGTGPKQGFDITLKVKPGKHKVCVYATSYGPGVSTVLGCRTVTTR